MRQQDATLDSIKPLIAGSETYRMRCPSCRKLYSVEPKHFALNNLSTTGAGALSKASQFECVDCETQFGAILGPDSTVAEALDTFIPEQPVVLREIPKTESVAVPVSSSVVVGRSCPKCATRNVTTAQECRSCGIVFAKFRTGGEERVMSEIQLAGRLELVSFWDTVAADYQNVDLHQEFVMACEKAGCLPFASHKYANILAVAPEEEIARKMRKQIIGFASRKLDKPAAQSFKFPLPSFNSLILLLGTFALVVGMGLPGASEVTPVGGAMIALAIGMRVFMRRPI
ncbi:MAG: hypothetical protein V4692_15050 [Bdellovibrionota bacterium]